MIHPSADISPTASIGSNTRVWHHAQIGDGARVGDECIVGSAVYVDRGVVIGSRVKIQTGAQLYRGAIVDDGVFIGPLVCICNDKHPRAITPEGRLRGDGDWLLGITRVHYGASLGAGAVVLPDISVGRFAMVGAGALVVESVPDYGLVLGVPGRLSGFVCGCGQTLTNHPAEKTIWECASCRMRYARREDGGLQPASEAGIEQQAS